MTERTSVAQPEPMRATLTRTVGIALVVGGVLAWRRGDLARWPVASALVLWPSLGGHFVERWYRDTLRPRLRESAGMRIAARLATWFVGGIALGLGMALTAILLTGAPRIPWGRWWLAGLAFVAIEAVAHLALRLAGRPSLFDGRG
jgi:hypothetical protein